MDYVSWDISCITYKKYVQTTNADIIFNYIKQWNEVNVLVSSEKWLQIKCSLSLPKFLSIWNIAILEFKFVNRMLSPFFLNRIYIFYPTLIVIKILHSSAEKIKQMLKNNLLMMMEKSWRVLIFQANPW